MVHLIDKDALIAEINELKKEVGDDEYWHGYDIALYEVLYFIDTLEVKEADDELECKIFPRPIECYSNCKECPWLATNNKHRKER